MEPIAEIPAVKPKRKYNRKPKQPATETIAPVATVTNSSPVNQPVMNAEKQAKPAKIKSETGLLKLKAITTKAKELRQMEEHQGKKWNELIKIASSMIKAQ